MVFLQDCRKAFLLLVFFTCLSQPSIAQEYNAHDVSAQPSGSWTELIFQGSKFMTSVTITIRLLSGDTISGNLKGGTLEDFTECSETVHNGQLLSVQRTSETAGFSQGQYEERVWFNKVATRPGKRIRINKSDSPWVKRYCFEDNGVRRQKFMPAGSREASLPFTLWSKRAESFYRYPEEATECAAISDPAFVFYMLSTFQSEWQQLPTELCIFGKKKLHRLKIRLEETSPLKVSFEKRSLDQKNTIEETITPLVFSFNAEPFTPGERESETFSFLGLHKDIRIYIDPQTRLPVKISGTNTSIGRLVLNLRAFSK